ncbi:MAG TPA: alginate export family protein [Acidobacteriota bacterium]|nr:alginate export family protein [Acidobacteriota bacterium]
MRGLAAGALGALFAASVAAPAAHAYIFGDPVTLADGRLALDFNARVRVEARENTFDFNSLTDTVNDDTFVLTRFRAGAKYTVSPTLSFYGQLQDAREFDSKRPNVLYVNAAEGDARLDLRQLYVDIGDPRDSGWSTRIGRQMLAYADQRLVGGFEWNNYARVFDGAKVVYNWADQRTTFDFLATSVVTPGETTPDRVKDYKLDRSDKDDLFLGVYVQNSGAIQNTKLDAYLLYRGKTENSPNFTVPAPAFGNGNVRAFDVPQKIYTLGVRAQNISIAPLKGFDYIVEGAYQWGEARPGLPATTVRGFDWFDHRAYAFHAETGYTWERSKFVPRLGVEYNYASGDQNPGDTKNEGFLNLFHTNHLHYGYMDAFSWKNMESVAVTFRARPFINVDSSLKKAVLRLDYHWLSLARTTDFWYRANAIAVVRPAASRTGVLPKKAGEEFDATLTWSPSAPYDVLLGWSHFNSGDYLAATGRADNASFAYAQLVVKF